MSAKKKKKKKKNLRPLAQLVEHPPPKRNVGSSSLSWPAVGEAKVVEAPGRGPGDSGFEFRHSPQSCYTGYMSDTDIHVYPTNDLIIHDTDTEDCICGPEIVAIEHDDGSIGWLIVHHSLDGRENNEV